jgi:hypothetical protein
VRRLVLVIAAALALAGCGHPLIPAAVIRRAEATTTPARGSSPPPAAVVPAPSLTAARPVLGVDLYALRNYSPAQVKADGERTLGYIKNTLHAGAVGIVWDFFAPSQGASTVLSTRSTLSPANVAILTRIARADHLAVEYRPLIMVDDPANHWEGLINPADPATWFASYFGAELPYLRVAQRLHVGEFVTSTEMHDLNGRPRWVSFLDHVRRVYHGITSYTEWDIDYFSAQPRFLPVHYLGMDMYHPVALPPSAPPARVAAAFGALLRGLPPGVLRRTAIDESGIQARAGAFSDPANLRAPGSLDQGVQAAWYTAACLAVRRFHLRGVFFWKVDLTDNPAHPATSLSTFEGKEGAAAIRGCARILY